MEKYSHLELLPTDLKLNIIKKMIRLSTSPKQAVQAVRTFIVGDRLLRKHNGHITHQKTIEDHLGWHWNDERPLALLNKSSQSTFFKSLTPSKCQDLLDPELLQLRKNFEHFLNHLDHMASEENIPENCLSQMDLDHCYKFNTNARIINTINGRTCMGIGSVRRQWTPLYGAVRYRYPQLINQLLQHNCDTQKLSDAGMTPLHLACSIGHQQIVKVLLEHKVPLNTQTPANKTALHIAEENGHMEIMNMLVRAGADHTIKNSEGYIAAQLIKNGVKLVS